MLFLSGIQKLRFGKKRYYEIILSMKFNFFIVLIKYVVYNNHKYINISFQNNVYNEILQTNYTLNIFSMLYKVLQKTITLGTL